MNKILTLFLVLTFGLSFSQTNDDLRSGSKKKQGSSGTSNSGSSSSSGGGISANDINLIINACGCLYDVGLAFASEVVVKGIKANTALIKARRDSFPRIKNLELNMGYGFYPDPFANPSIKLRMQAGVIGTSFRSSIRLDRTNIFSPDALAYYDWQILEFNVLNRKHGTIRFGGGFMFDPTARNKNGIYEGGDLSVYGEFMAGGDVFFYQDQLRLNLEARITPFGEVKARKEAFSRLYYRVMNKNKLHLEVFGGGNYQQLFDRFNLWYVEAGAGIMLY